MVRPSWITSLTIALALGGEAVAQQIAPPASEPRTADYVVETQSDDESEPDSSTSQRELGYTINKPTYSNASDGQPEVIKERFASSAIKIERHVTQDAQGNYVNHGPWKEWDERGNLISQGDYDHGNRTGTWVRWYRGTKDAEILAKMPYQQFGVSFISQATFKNGQLDGTWTIYDAKMHKISQFELADGRRHGTSTWWYANGKKMREIQFRDGEIDGQYLEFSPEGATRVKDVYQAGRKLGMKTAHYKDNKKKLEGMYLFAKEIEQTPDDWWACKMMTTTKTGHDEKHGAFIAWHPSGQKQQEGTFEHDVQVGAFVWWHANGQKALEGSFVQGKQDGAWTWWYPSGQKSIQGEYSSGNPTGRWTWWKEDGKVAQSADLSHSEGVVIESPATPRTLDAPSTPRMTKAPPAAHTSKPQSRPPVKR